MDKGVKHHNSEPLNLLALTPCCVDYYPQINKSFMGGNSLNVAAQWNKMEPESTISVITCLGNDKNGNRIHDFLGNIGLDTSRVYRRDGLTASNKMRVDEEGERFGIEGAWQGGVYETFLLSDSDWDWLARQDIVAMPGNNPNFSAMLEKKHDDQFLAVDYLDIENQIPFENTLEATDIAFITARTELLPKYSQIAFEKKKLIVVTLGAAGSYAYYEGETYHQAALPVPEVVDTTGAGDAYQAAFALTYYRTRNIPESMIAGAKAAAEIVQAWGGVGKVE